MATKEDQNAPKKRSLRIKDRKPQETDKIKRKQEVPKKCTECKQYIDQALVYNGHPNNSVEEVVSVSSEAQKQEHSADKEAATKEDNEMPSLKITHFTFYDKKGHLCPFDSGLIEKNVQIFASGYVKAIFEDNPEPEGGMPTRDIGPINTWWTTGFDGGEKVLVGVSTEYAEYYLMEPSPEYQPLWNLTVEKGMVFKLTIEFLLEEAWRDPSYEDLIQHLESSGKLNEPEETLIKNAQYVCDQVNTFYDGEDPPENEPPLITVSCVKALMKLAGVTFKNGSKVRRTVPKDLQKKKKTTLVSEATTTKLVQSLFKNIFPNKTEKKAEERTVRQKKQKPVRRRRCGVCKGCRLADCGKCSNCKDMVKFGGSGKSRQACKLRKCANMGIPEAEESNEDQKDAQPMSRRPQKSDTKDQSDAPLISTTQKTVSQVAWKPVQWLKEPTEKTESRTYYNRAKVSILVIESGDYVMVSPENPSDSLIVAEVMFMYQESEKRPMFHAHLFTRGTDTIIGDISDPRELFAGDNCGDYLLGAVVQKASVEIKKPPEDWASLGGTVDVATQPKNSDSEFYISKRYERISCRFVDYIQDKPLQNECSICKRKFEAKKYEEPILSDSGTILWRGNTYSIGTAVFLSPKVYGFNKFDSEDAHGASKDIDEQVYPEFYRKKSDDIKEDTSKPFIIATIEGIASPSSIQFRLFCRSEDTTQGLSLAFQKDLNLVYWTNTIISTEFKNVMGICTLSFDENVNNIEEWSRKGPYRFYFTQAYDLDSNKFEEVPPSAKSIGRLSKGKGKGKGKSDKVDSGTSSMEWQQLVKPLKCMDIFAGCGGFSEGLRQSGVAETLWAFETDTTAFQAFKLNNPECKVFHDDYSEILNQIISGKGKNRELPEKGEVELLVGSLPSQGVSEESQLNPGQYAQFKNSLVTCLGYCDYYRPKYFILESLRNSDLIRLTIRCLLAMEYQVTLGILQAGQYGVPQNRKRPILIAAAPGFVMPKFPEPLHVFFNNQEGTMSSLDGTNQYCVDFLWKESAPYRMLCMKDAISDLPPIKNGHSQLEMPYNSDPCTHFQRMMRYDNESDLVGDHICKEMSPIVQARISHIPTYPGADWRDLPNISVGLSDGTVTYKLRYPYRTPNQSSKEPLRGVCACSIGRPCDPTDRQNNTLIPWCLSHMADHHEQWAGLYGRLGWEGIIESAITNPEPMGKQGRVLHPEQNRVVSVRECARFQGFPDRFRFYGNILDKHRQIGTALPPPLGCAIGKEILKAYVESVGKENNSPKM